MFFPYTTAYSVVISTWQRDPYTIQQPSDELVVDVNCCINRPKLNKRVWILGQTPCSLRELTCLLTFFPAQPYQPCSTPIFGRNLDVA